MQIRTLRRSCVNVSFGSLFVFRLLLLKLGCFVGRRAKKEATGSSRRGATNFPDMKDHEAVQRFFLQEVQLGEELLAAGDLENGVDHLGNAVAVCGQPNELLQVLQQTLQPQVFHLLIQRLPQIAPRFMKQQAKPTTLQEDDVE